MNAPLTSIFARVTVGLVAGGAGALAGVVAQAIWSYRAGYVGAPSVAWATAGAVIGFAVGTYCGNKTYTGRPAWLVSGIVAGFAAGILIGWGLARSEFAFDRQRLLKDGIRADFLDDSKQGLFAGHYEAIGLRYGAFLGIVAGLALGFCWMRSLRSNRASQIAVAAAVCAITIGVISMEQQFGRLSMHNLSFFRRSWDHDRERWTRWGEIEARHRAEFGAVP